MTDPQPHEDKVRWQGDFMTLAVCAFLALALLRAYMTRPSEAFTYWSGSILALMLCEYFAAFAGAGALMYRKTVLAGQPDWRPLVIIGGIVLMGVAVGANFLELLALLAYIALLAARIRLGLTVTANRIPELNTRFVVAIVANLVTLFPALFAFKTPGALTMAGFFYFSLLVLFEVRLIMRRLAD